MESAIVQPTGLELRNQLLHRRDRLETVISEALDPQPLARLLAEVDATLDRIDRGKFGLCDVCHDPVEGERIHVDPLVRTCLECLSQAEQRALERDLDLAGHVQRTLLPPRTFRIDGWEAGYQYQPAGSASGDYVDLMTLDSGEAVFLVGDVSGKGLASSLLMAHLHAIVRSLIALQLPFAELLERTNRIFYESVGGSQYATLVCGKASRSGEIELSNAGHCPAILVRGDTAAMLPATTVPVGLFASAPFPTMRLTLRPGDALVLYTDGVTETTNSDEEEYGTEKLMAAIGRTGQAAVADVISGCLADLAKFRGEGPRRDDLTLFVLKRRGQA